MPQSIVISDQDVDSVAQATGWEFEDPARRQALMCTDCRDIQACPGSGKTTLVVAKLMILAGHWRWRDRGVCVLSHTNVAREEVETRVTQHPVGHRLLHYPHFIGTIQRFVDEFLALPYMRSMGITIHSVDNDRFASRAMSCCRRQEFRTARNHLARRHDRGRGILSGLRWEGPSLSLGSAHGGVPRKKKGPVYQQLRQLKDLLCDEGYFRFDDMYAYAQAYIGEHPWIVEGVRARFPWVLVDEMQDTDAMQDELLHSLFGEHCILQRFGDVNQAIYGGVSVAGSQASFPGKDHIQVSGSMRFGPRLASFASRLTCVEPQQLLGVATVDARRHTVFLFDDEYAILKVLPAFGALLAEEYPCGLPDGYTAKAVGFRKSEPGQRVQRRFPFNIRDYWPEFQPSLTTTSARSSTLIECVRRARHAVRCESECHAGYQMIIDGLVSLLHLQGASDESGMRFTKTRLLEACERTDQARALQFRDLLVQLCLPDEQIRREWWDRMTDSVKRVLSPWAGDALVPEAQRFMRWVEQPGPSLSSQGRLSADLPNVYRHPSAVGSIDVEVTTINAAKGQTHDATLVLETCWERQHDLRELLPYIVGKQAAGSQLSDKTLERMKRIFVATTRPRELLCLAMHSGHVSAKQKTALEQLGWCIEDLGD